MKNRKPSTASSPIARSSTSTFSASCSSRRIAARKPPGMFGRRKKVLAAAGVQAPPFRLTSLDGSMQTLQDILAGGPVLLAFYKISCPVCQLTAPYLQRLAANDALQVIGVSQDDASATRGFMQRFGITFPTLLDLSSENYPASNAYGITSVPSLFLLER